MTSGYRVKTVKLASGEQLPVLLDSNGVPLFEPTLFALTEVRAGTEPPTPSLACFAASWRFT